MRSNAQGHPVEFVPDVNSTGYNLDSMDDTDDNDDTLQLHGSKASTPGGASHSRPPWATVAGSIPEDEEVDHRITIRTPMPAMGVTLAHREIIAAVTEDEGRITQSLPGFAVPRTGPMLMQREPRWSLRRLPSDDLMAQS